MSLYEIRQQSLKAAKALGYRTNPALPLEDELAPKTEAEIVRRLLALNGVIAATYRFDRQKIRAWLEQEGAWDSLTDEERLFIVEYAGHIHHLRDRIEAMWALAWALSLVDTFDFGAICSDNFYLVLPNLPINESGDRLRSKAHLRPQGELVAARDLAYCLHWAIRDAVFNGRKIPGKVDVPTIVERRRALEWMLSEHPWDEVHMDT